MNTNLPSKSILGAFTCLFSIACLLGCFQAVEAAEKVKAKAKKMSTAESKVRETIDLHFKGIQTGDMELFKQAWDISSAHVKHVRYGKAISQPVEEALALWTKKPDKKTEGKILSVDIIGERMAVAKVDLNWHGGEFTDFLTLLKTRDGWKIVEKTYINLHPTFLYSTGY